MHPVVRLAVRDASVLRPGSHPDVPETRGRS